MSKGGRGEDEGKTRGRQREDEGMTRAGRRENEGRTWSYSGSGVRRLVGRTRYVGRALTCHPVSP